MDLYEKEREAIDKDQDEMIKHITRVRRDKDEALILRCLSGIIPDLDELIYVKRIYITYSNIKHFPKLPISLEKLYIEDCQFIKMSNEYKYTNVEVKMNDIKYLHNLKSFKIINNKMYGTFNFLLPDNLIELDISNNYLQFFDFNNLPKKLQKFNYEDNYFDEMYLKTNLNFR